MFGEDINERFDWTRFDVVSAFKNKKLNDFDTTGECISTLIDDNCKGLKGKYRAECNHTQQNRCFTLFGKAKPQ